MKFIRILSLLVLLTPVLSQAASIPGAIRWSPWYGSPNGVSVQRTLGPTTWQTRMPFFGTVNSPYDVTINGNQQATIDAEIEYGKNGGIKYWAYLWYKGTGSTLGAPYDPMMNAWQLHQSSTVKNDMNWALMLPLGDITGASWFTSNQATLISWFQQSNYQKVLTGRPVFYIYIDNYNTDLSTYWGNSNANVASAISSFRSAVTTAGVATPYIILMYGTGGAQDAQQIGADATSNYIGNLGTVGQATTWASAEANLETYWSQLASQATTYSIGMVPIAMDGWDTRPRSQNIVAWENSNHNHFGQSIYVVAPTASQLTTELQDCANFVAANPSTNPSQLILIYAWDECDEGGCIMPLYSSSGPNLTKLNALAAVSW